MKILLLALTCLLFSCAKKELYLTKKYLVPYKDFNVVTTVEVPTKKIFLQNVQDARSEKLVVGEARTGVQYQKTPIYLEEDFEAYFMNYFKSSFKKRMFNVSEEQSKSTLSLNIVINKLWVEESFSKGPQEKAKCEIDLTLYLTDSNTHKEKWKGHFWTEIMSPGDLGDGSSKLAPTFSSCLNTVIEKIIHEPKFLDNLKK